jgi:hypothetical protein
MKIILTGNYSISDFLCVKYDLNHIISSITISAKYICDELTLKSLLKKFSCYSPLENKITLSINRVRMG